jgi:hypothetical protein
MYIVYKTTNITNKKFYIGVHKTSNLDDGYIGSGKILKRAIKNMEYKTFIDRYFSFLIIPMTRFQKNWN